MYNTTGCRRAQGLWAFPKAGSQDGAASDSCAWTNVCVLFPQLLPWPQTGAQDPSRPRCGYPQKCAQSGISPSITRPFRGCFPATLSGWKPGSACCKKLIIIPPEGCRPPPTAHQRRHLQHLPRNPYPNAGSCGEDSHTCSNSNCASLSKRPQAPAGYWRSGSDLHGTGSCFWCGPIRPANSGLVPCKLKCNPYYAVTHRPYRRDNWVSVPPYFSSVWEVSLDAG